MSRFPKFLRRGEGRTFLFLLAILAGELVAGVGLACASWTAGGTPGPLSALPDWTALAMPVAPLTVLFFLNLLP
jgi:hypothetical protein